MILFKPEHVEPILSGRKIDTRRMGRRRWRDGAVHQARTRMLDASSTFAHLRILRVTREPLGAITEQGAWTEGYDSRTAYLDAFAQINGSAPLDLPVWVVRFERTLEGDTP